MGHLQPTINAPSEREVQHSPGSGPSPLSSSMLSASEPLRSAQSSPRRPEQSDTNTFQMPTLLDTEEEPAQRTNSFPKPRPPQPGPRNDNPTWHAGEMDSTPPQAQKQVVRVPRGTTIPTSTNESVVPYRYRQVIEWRHFQDLDWPTCLHRWKELGHEDVHLDVLKSYVEKYGREWYREQRQSNAEKREIKKQIKIMFAWFHALSLVDQQRFRQIFKTHAPDLPLGNFNREITLDVTKIPKSILQPLDDLIRPYMRPGVVSFDPRIKRKIEYALLVLECCRYPDWWDAEEILRRDLLSLDGLIEEDVEFELDMDWLSEGALWKLHILVVSATNPQHLGYFSKKVTREQRERHQRKVRADSIKEGPIMELMPVVPDRFSRVRECAQAVGAGFRQPQDSILETPTPSPPKNVGQIDAFPQPNRSAPTARPRPVSPRPMPQQSQANGADSRTQYEIMELDRETAPTRPMSPMSMCPQSRVNLPNPPTQDEVMEMYRETLSRFPIDKPEDPFEPELMSTDDMLASFLHRESAQNHGAPEEADNPSARHLADKITEDGPAADGKEERPPKRKFEEGTTGPRKKSAFSTWLDTDPICNME